MAVEQASLPKIGRRLTDTTTKHGAKRVRRFTCNRRVKVAAATEPPVRRFSKGRKKNLLGGYPGLDGSPPVSQPGAAAVLKRQGKPLLRANWKQRSLYKSQNNLETGRLRPLKPVLPDYVKDCLGRPRFWPHRVGPNLSIVGIPRPDSDLAARMGEANDSREKTFVRKPEVGEVQARRAVDGDAGGNSIMAFGLPSGRSSAWLERCVRDAEVASSNLVAPIRYK
jgi:hypothetical protein